MILPREEFDETRDWDNFYATGSSNMWEALRRFVGAWCGRRKWFDNRFANVRDKRDRLHAREQLLAEVWGWADPC